MARATFDEGAKVRRWKKNLEDPRRALKQIGVLMVAETRNAFRDQKFGKVRWQPRSDVNVFGIIADFAKSGTSKPPKRRFERRPALKDTGQMQKSFAFKVLGRHVVEVGASPIVAERASIHHFGGPVESETITEEVQSKLWKWLKRQSVKLKRRLGWLLNKKYTGKKLEGEVPKRPLVGVTEQTFDDVREAVGVYIMEI